MSQEEAIKQVFQTRLTEYLGEMRVTEAGLLIPTYNMHHLYTEGTEETPWDEVDVEACPVMRFTGTGEVMIIVNRRGVAMASMRIVWGLTECLKVTQFGLYSKELLDRESIEYVPELGRLLTLLENWVEDTEWIRTRKSMDILRGL